MWLKISWYRAFNDNSFRKVIYYYKKERDHKVSIMRLTMLASCYEFFPGKSPGEGARCLHSVLPRTDSPHRSPAPFSSTLTWLDGNTWRQAGRPLAGRGGEGIWKWAVWDGCCPPPPPGPNLGSWHLSGNSGACMHLLMKFSLLRA